MAVNETIRAEIVADWGEQLADYVLTVAREYWQRAGNEEDFCMQHYSGTGVVFGGLNRVAWSIEGGFVIDSKYCSLKFLAANAGYRAMPSTGCRHMKGGYCQLGMGKVG